MHLEYPRVNASNENESEYMTTYGSEASEITQQSYPWADKQNATIDDKNRWRNWFWGYSKYSEAPSTDSYFYEDSTSETHDIYQNPTSEEDSWGTSFDLPSTDSEEISSELPPWWGRYKKRYHERTSDYPYYRRYYEGDYPSASEETTEYPHYWRSFDNESTNEGHDYWRTYRSMRCCTQLYFATLNPNLYLKFLFFRW